MSGANYKRTVAACMFGIINQAAVTNLTAVLFVYFIQLYGFSLSQLGLLIGINFGVQLLADILLTFVIDRFGFRPLVMTACAISAVGFLLYGAVGLLAPSFATIALATVVFAFSGGMCEVILSPIVDNIPESVKSKQTAMSMMHSFYAWGQIGCIVLTTAMIALLGPARWPYVAMLFAVTPLIALVLFLHAPLDKKQTQEKAADVRRTGLSPFFLVALLAILLGGASEVSMNQWVSTFLVEGMGVEKTIADLLGMGLFALCIGIVRGLYGKFGDRWNLSRMLAVSSLLSAGLYVAVGLSHSAVVSMAASVLCGLTVGLLWPGTLVLASKKFPSAGAWIFAVLAIFGDVGATVVPTVTGYLSEWLGLHGAFLALSVIPLGAFFCHLYLARHLQPEAGDLSGPDASAESPDPIRTEEN